MRKIHHENSHHFWLFTFDWINRSLLRFDLVRIRGLVGALYARRVIQPSIGDLTLCGPFTSAHLVDHDPLAGVGSDLVNYLHLLGPEAL